jgi:glycogen operon protein
LVAGSFQTDRFSWRDDQLPHIPKEDMVIYKLHVRGFSMDMPGESKDKGTIRCLDRKIRYLKELGITTLELMPIYEFEEVFACDNTQKKVISPDKINYWGYTSGHYFAPKASYLGGDGSGVGLKQTIRLLHKNKMECVLEFYFSDDENPIFIVEVLRYWAKEYHIDGFHLIGAAAAASLAANDLYLAKRKLFFHSIPEELLQGNARMELFTYNDAFAYAARKILNQQDGSLVEFSGQMRRQHLSQGFINFITNNNGFTLFDLFSYTIKNNIENLEENQDGNDWNYSINCGTEGFSKKKRIIDLRMRHIKNALAMVFFSQGTPLLWMGDEHGNSQNGNNNAYCQDNPVGWKNWPSNQKSKEIQEFLKKIILLRLEYPVLRNPTPLRMEDYKRVGCPDLSYHGEGGWLFDYSTNPPAIGMLYSGEYAAGKQKEAEFIYIVYNFCPVAMHLALPDLYKKNVEWVIRMDTGAKDIFQEITLKKEEYRTFHVKRQSICLLVGKEGKEKYVTEQREKRIP